MDHGRRHDEHRATTWERAPGPVAYRTCRENVTRLLGEHPDTADLIVPACPEWTVRDLVAHILEGCRARYRQPADAQPPLPPLDELDIAELLDEWKRMGPHVEEALAGAGGFSDDVLVMDAFTHELDLRRVFEAPPPDDDHPAYPTALGLVLNGFSASVNAHGFPALRIETEGAQWTVGRGEAAAAVRAHHFDLYRSIAGRRTHRQIAELAWSASAETWLPAFTWGPFDPPVEATEEVIDRSGAYR